MNINVTANSGNRIDLQVTPVPQQVIQINRGVAGPPGPNTIGGYPININNAQPQDVLMFGTNQWVNTPQNELADGGNF